jgi:hypothetical protein
VSAVGLGLNISPTLTILPKFECHWCCPECEREIDGTERYLYEGPGAAVLVNCPNCGNLFFASEGEYVPIAQLATGQAFMVDSIEDYLEELE